jgi:hypothetical protein
MIIYAALAIRHGNLLAGGYGKVDIRGRAKSPRRWIPFLTWAIASCSFVVWAFVLIHQAVLDDDAELALQKSSVTVPSGKEVLRNSR